MDDQVQAYLDGIAADCRVLFDRLHQLILEVRPDAQVALSYGMPTYRAGSRRLSIGAWKHGVSIYGSTTRHAAFIARHPELRTSRGTIRMSAADAAAVTEEDLRGLVRAALEP